MESNSRSVWILVVAALALLCCSIATAAAIVAVRPFGFVQGVPFYSAPDVGATGAGQGLLEESFEVGANPVLEIDNFAGGVTVLAGEPGTIHVAATKNAGSNRDLARITVEIEKRDGGIAIKTRKPSFVSDVSVQLDIVVPAGTRLDAHTGAGSVEAHGLRSDVQVHTDAGSVVIVNTTGEIEARTGAGSITVQGAQNQVHLDTSTGSISYQGTPLGWNTFETGAGSIRLELPTDPNVGVELVTSLGSIQVDFDVEGKVSKRKVDGAIGRGDQGDIYARTGVGSITLFRQE